MIPFNITFVGIQKSDAVWLAVQNRIEKIERFYNRIIRCEVTISSPNKNRKSDNPYHINVHVIMPGEDIVINKTSSKIAPQKSIYVTIRAAFDNMERILEERSRKFRSKTKSQHYQYQEGRISKLRHLNGYGFLNVDDGREYYFDESCITNENFSRLKVGQKVKFLDEPGEKGPQVITMAVI